VRHPIEFDPEASLELDQAARWYEGQRSGLGSDFLRASGRTIDRLAEQRVLGLRIPALMEQRQIAGSCWSRAATTVHRVANRRLGDAIISRHGWAAVRRKLGDRDSDSACRYSAVAVQELRSAWQRECVLMSGWVDKEFA